MNEWAVGVTFAVDEPLDRELLGTVWDKFDAVDWSVFLTCDGHLSINWFCLYPDSIDASRFVWTAADEALGDAGIQSYRLLRLCTMSEEEREREIEAPQLPELLAAGGCCSSAGYFPAAGELAA